MSEMSIVFGDPTPVTQNLKGLTAEVNRILHTDMLEKRN